MGAVLIGGIVVVALVAVVAAIVMLRRRAHDDVHSVEHYHRQLHTLEEMRAHDEARAGAARTHGGTAQGERAEGGRAGSDEAGVDQAGSDQAGADKVASGVTDEHFPVSAVRVSDSSTVRLMEPGRQPVPPVAPPRVPHPSEPVSFDDTGAGPAPIPRTFMTGIEDRAMHSIDHRPRQWGGSLAAIGAVVLLIVVLIATGLHTSLPAHKARESAVTTAPPVRGRGGHAGTHRATGNAHAATTSTTAPPPVVSAPGAVSVHAATYQVASQSYTLAVAATTGACWVQVTDTATGAVLFTGTLSAGQRDSVTTSGPATVVAGATSAFAVAIDGTLVALPPGAQAPFTLTFQPVAAG